MNQIITRTYSLITFVFAFLICILWSTFLHAQVNTEEQLLKKKQHQEERSSSKTIELFAPEIRNEKSYPNGSELPPGLVLKYDRRFATEVLKSNHRNIEVELPDPNGGENLILILERKEIFTPDFKVFLDIENQIAMDYTPGLHYAGTVKGMKGTQVGISIFEDEIMGIVATQSTNLVLQKIKGSEDDHFFFDERFADKEEMLLCATPDSGEPYKFGPVNNIEQKLFGNCIRIFVEIGNSTVQDRGGMIQGINFATGVFHQSTLIFNAEAINTYISQILVRTAANDPYDPLADKSTENIRNTFQAQTAAMNADLGQLLVTFGTGTGGIAADVWNALIRPAVADRLCITSKAVGANFNVYPTYSRLVKVFNHELGHLLASRHTHACVWNGNDTQIDDYGNVTGPSGTPSANPEGEDCLDPMNPILNVTPTIMSYFDSRSHGDIPLANGYGTQPGNVIRGAVATALISNQIETSCAAPLNDLCTNAWTLQCGTTLYGNIDNATATNAPGGCESGGNGTDPGVWFTFTGNGQVFTISTANSDFDTQINIFTGSCGNLTCLDGDDDSGPGLTSSITFCTVNGTQYWVYLDGFGGASGNYTINLTCVNDVIPPQVTCPANVNVNNDPGDCGAIVAYPPATATDNCGVQSITYSQNSGTFFPVGNNIVTVTATDINNNTATCTFSVAVVDNEPPTIMCSDGSVVFNGEDEHILDPDDFTVYDDNCGIQSVVLDPPVITCEDLGDILVIIATVTDIHGNTNDCTFNLEVLGLPCGWSFSPDGINCPGGNDVSYSVPLDEFYVESSNCFFAHPFNSDVMGFAQYELCGDGSLTAHVTDISGNALGWAGLSMRENNDGGAKKVQLLTNRSNFSRREIRFETNGNSFPQQFMSLNRYWLRLTRSGNQFSGYVSSNGMNWFFVMAGTVIMPECIQIGLVVTNYNSNSTVTATFANVVVDEAMMMPAADNYPVTFRENAGANKLQVYPNPSDGTLYIDYSQVMSGTLDIQVIDPLGRTVRMDSWSKADQSLQTMQLHNLPAGVYYLRFSGDGGFNETRRIVLSSQN